MSDAESDDPNVVGITPSGYPDGDEGGRVAIDDLMNASSGSPALAASPFRSSSAGPTAPEAPAAASAWQPPQVPLPVNIVLPLAALPVAPFVPPVEPPPVSGGGVDVGVDTGRARKRGRRQRQRSEPDARSTARRGAREDDQDDHHHHTRDGSDEPSGENLDHGRAHYNGCRGEARNTASRG